MVKPTPVNPTRLLVRAHAIRVRLLQEPSLPLKEIAAEEGNSRVYLPPRDHLHAAGEGLRVLKKAV
jgi:hypothetical protein